MTAPVGAAPRRRCCLRPTAADLRRATGAGLAFGLFGGLVGLVLGAAIGGLLGAAVLFFALLSGGGW